MLDVLTIKLCLLSKPVTPCIHHKLIFDCHCRILF